MTKFTPESPISPDLVLKVSNENNFPVEFLLAVGHNESHLGTYGRGAKTFNPMNVGNTDGGDYKPVKCGVYNNCLTSWEEGLKAFISLIQRCYFNEEEVIDLQTWVDRDFRAVRCNIKGLRYMTDTKAKEKYLERINNLKTL